MRRPVVLLGIATVGLGCALVAWWWTTPGSGDGCGSDGANSCSSFVLDVDALELIEPELARFGLESTGSELIVAIESRSTENSEYADHLLVAVFDAKDGSLLRVLLERSGRSGAVTALAPFPDGDRLAVGMAMVGSDGEPFERIEIIDVASGAAVSKAEVDAGESNCLIGVAPDGSQFTCFGRLYDTTTGALVGPSDDVVGFVSAYDWLSAAARTEPRVDGSLVGGAGDSIRIRTDAAELTIETAPSAVHLQDGTGRLAISPLGNQIVHQRSGASWSLRSFDGPHRSHTAAEIIVYDTGDGSVVRRIELGRRAVDVAWLDDVHLVTIDEDFRVAVHDLG